jgi:AraC family transcriptional regulator
MSDAHRVECLRRIHRVQDYIELHLAEDLTLDAIAKSAGFSPFHFHRLYTAITGETLYQFILRLRLERAANHLGIYPDRSVTEIAFTCGFSSSATFARAFRAEYGLSATQYRNLKGETASTDEVTLKRKNRKTLSKIGKAVNAAIEHNDFVDTELVSSRSHIMSVKAKNVVVEELEAFTVAYVRHVGPYAGDAALFERLFAKLSAWAGPRRLLGPNTKSLSIYHDNPEITESAKLRLSCCVSVPAGTKAEGEIGIMTIPAGTYARAHFELSAQEFGGAWDWFMGEWMPQSGYKPTDGVCYEQCLDDPSHHPEGKFVVDLVEPVEPL